jgi:hypothetical protein
MNVSEKNRIVFARRASGSVYIDIGNSERPAVPEKPEKPRTFPDAAAAEEIHPLLLLYPFDAPARKPQPAVDSIPAPIVGLPMLEDRFSDLPDIDMPLNLDVPETVLQETPVGLDRQPSGKRKRCERRTKPWQVGIWRKYRSSDWEEIWSRHGMLLSLLMICHLASSLQMSRLYRFMMDLETSTLALLPAMFLGLMFTSFAVIRIMDGRRCESVAVAIIAMTGASAFTGLLCKVVMVLNEAV